MTDGDPIALSRQSGRSWVAVVRPVAYVAYGRTTAEVASELVAMDGLADAPRCLVCDIELEVPAGGGRVPRFCSGAHRARYNRDRRADGALPCPAHPPAVAAAPLVAEFEAQLAALSTRGRRLVHAVTAAQALTVQLDTAVARAERAEAERDVPTSGLSDARGEATGLKTAVQTLTAQLATEKELRAQMISPQSPTGLAGRTY